MNNKNSGFYIALFVIIIIFSIIVGIAHSLLLNFLEENRTSSPNSTQEAVTSPEKSPYSSKTQKDVDIASNFAGKTTEIKLRPLEEFSGMNAAEILDLRKNAVKNSLIFGGNPNYTPSSDVFQIEDKLPWIGAHEVTCNSANNNPNIGKGTSRESLGILNPELLLYIILPSYEISKMPAECSEIDYHIPYKVIYDKDFNTITAYINYSDFYRKVGVYYGIILADANAHDLGYNYVYISESENIKYKYDSNASTNIVSTRGFYHRGGSCGLPQGCNNYSPYESGYHFYLKGTPASIHVKLWKKQPFSEHQKADINYVMKFE